MIVNRRVVRGFLQISFAAAAISTLASCSTVTYGTGVGTTAQTVRDLTGPLNFLRSGDDTINYAEPRPDELNTNTDGTLPPPTTTTDGDAATLPPQLTPTNTACGGNPGDPAPPDADCTPNPNAPALVHQGAGIFGTADTAIRQLTDPCQWWLVQWAQMTGEEQDAFGRLGWNASNWGATDPTLLPDTVAKTWADLSRRERRAAESLGFDETSWNSCTVL